MAILSGDILALNSMEAVVHAVGAPIFARLDGKVVGIGEVTANDDFAIELPDELHGEIEVVLGMLNAAPSLVMFEGQDVHITVMYSNVNNFLA